MDKANHGLNAESDYAEIVDECARRKGDLRRVFDFAATMLAGAVRRQKAGAKAAAAN